MHAREMLAFRAGPGNAAGMAEVRIREQVAADAAAVRRVNERAFARRGEADLVEALDRAGAVLLALVAEWEDQVIGHLLLSPVTVTGAAASYRAAGLAPMAVDPVHQRQGTGAQLVRAAVAQLRRSAQPALFVLGHPGYYPRFGFRPASAWGVRWEHPCPDEAFLLLALRPSLVQSGLLRYRPEFDLVAGSL
jgi:putative acetyltransferase